MGRTREHAVVVGGGPAGLAVAIGMAEVGWRVTLLERGSALGGRARSHELRSEGQFLGTVNLGPHALYASAERMLAELGVRVTGGVPSKGLTLQLGDRLAPVPAGAGSLLANPWLGFADKARLAKLFAGLPFIDIDALHDVTVAAWLEGHGLRGVARDVALALVRVATYTHAPERASAAVAVMQLRAAVDGVRYLDGGWQTIVDGMQARAEALGVEVRCGDGAAAIDVEAGRARRVHTRTGEVFDADAIALAIAPRGCLELLGEHASGSLVGAVERLVPVRAACLDVALDPLPRRHPALILGVDRPRYLSIHSNVARLARDGGGLVSAARYLAPDEKGSAAHRRELEALLDEAQPGWREGSVEMRWRPTMTVTHALPEARFGGLRQRPAVDAAGLHGLALAGDWVGEEHLLLDAALASARAAVNTLRACSALEPIERRRAS